MTELRRQAALAERLLHAQGPGRRRLPPATMPRGRFDALRLELATASACTSSGDPSCSRARRLPAARALDRALRPRRPPRRARAAEARSPRKAFRARAQAAAAALPAPHRSRHRQRRRGEARRARDDHRSLPARAHPRRGDVRPGPARGCRDRRGAEAVARAPEVDVVVLARGGGSFDDLLPFSDERLVRAIAACPVPVVSAVGHEQDTPLCDLAADVRASTPTAAGKLVVPDLGELRRDLARAAPRSRAASAARSSASRGARARHAAWSEAPGGARARAPALALLRDRLRRAPALLVERRRAASSAPARGSRRSLAARDARARVRDRPRRGRILRSRTRLAAGERVDVELAAGGFGAVWRTSGDERRRTERRRADLRGGAEGARADRRAARARAAEPRRGDRALGARRGAAIASASPASTPPTARSRSSRANRDDDSLLRTRRRSVESRDGPPFSRHAGDDAALFRPRAARAAQDRGVVQGARVLGRRDRSRPKASPAPASS